MDLAKRLVSLLSGLSGTMPTRPVAPAPGKTRSTKGRRKRSARGKTYGPTPPGEPHLKKRAAHHGPHAPLRTSRLVVPEIRKRRSERDPATVAKQQAAAFDEYQRTRLL